MAHLLSVQGLVTTFRNEGKEFNAIEGVNLHVDRGEIVGIVGESGSGKSVTMLSVLQLIASPGRVAGGEVYLEGVEGNLLSYGKESETMRHSGIGITKLRAMSNDESCQFVLWNGAKRLIKRRELDKYTDKAYSI